MEFTSFRFVFISPDYLEKLHDVDSEVFYSPDTDYSKKPHLGILTSCNGRKYVIPLTSAKPKHATWRDITATNYRIYEEIDIRTAKIDQYDIIVDDNVVESVAFINGCENSISEYIDDYYTEYDVEATYEIVE